MKLRELHLTKTDIALSNFARALALPVRICIIRYVLENANTVEKDLLYQKIPFSRDTINLHLLDLKKLAIIKTINKSSHIYVKVNEDIFIPMSNAFLTLFEPVGQINNEAKEIFSRPKRKTKPAKPKTTLTEEALFKTFGKFLREKRKAIGLSQTEFAAKFQLDRGKLSQIESSKRSLKPENLKLLAELINMPLPDVIKLYQQDQINKLTAETQQYLDNTTTH